MSTKSTGVFVVALLVMAAPLGAGALADTGSDGPPHRPAVAPISTTPAQVTQGDVSSLAPRGRWNPSTSTGELILDGTSYYTVYQGERDITRWRRASAAT